MFFIFAEFLLLAGIRLSTTEDSSKMNENGVNSTASDFPLQDVTKVRMICVR